MRSRLDGTPPAKKCSCRLSLDRQLKGACGDDGVPGPLAERRNRRRRQRTVTGDITRGWVPEETRGHRVMMDLSRCPLGNGRHQRNKSAARPLPDDRRGKASGRGACTGVGTAHVLHSGQPALHRPTDPEWQVGTTDDPRPGTSTCLDLEEEQTERCDEISTCLGTARTARNLDLRAIDRQSCPSQQNGEVVTFWHVQGGATLLARFRPSQAEGSTP